MVCDAAVVRSVAASSVNKSVFATLFLVYKTKCSKQTYNPPMQSGTPLKYSTHLFTTLGSF